ncbi:MauE/DoxX family redox-associated membrane protein [Streptomyces hainanensis]|uniref:Methylamine utilisation protein MauE domain-containing protein n=1 Tax=Streptomyces hainanensis TaxID=402648 RepID=A0A4V2Y442_9ACTN|nr:MauE/DoxX family redox-associated membrane protein [Streptomyces hainanensis]TDC78975.1 hypothetical protein E1283_03865 [Streptomyces hainanensis]
MQYVVIGVRCLLGGVFLLSVMSKVRGSVAFDAFVESVKAISPTPAARARSVAGLVVAVEGLLCALLLAPVPRTHPWALAGAVALLVGFALAIAASLLRGVREPCRCFGTSMTPLGWQHVARNAVLAGIAVFAVAATPESPAMHAQETATAVVTGLIAALLVASFDDLFALFHTPGREP